VATALQQALQPIWEPVFLPQSMGFRPNRGVLRLLAELERVMIDQDRWCWPSTTLKKPLTMWSSTTL
jgi:retron-type reverse transcriptase